MKNLSAILHSNVKETNQAVRFYTDHLKEYFTVTCSVLMDEGVLKRDTTFWKRHNDGGLSYFVTEISFRSRIRVFTHWRCWSIRNNPLPNAFCVLLSGYISSITKPNHIKYELCCPPFKVQDNAQNNSQINVEALISTSCQTVSHI